MPPLSTSYTRGVHLLQLMNLHWCLAITQSSQEFTFNIVHAMGLGFPVGTSGEEPTCQCRRCKRRRFDPWVGKIPWRRAWQPTPVFLPGWSVHRVAQNRTWLKWLNTPHVGLDKLIMTRYDHGKDMRWGREYVENLFSAQLWCEPKTALKNKANWFFKNVISRLFFWTYNFGITALQMANWSVYLFLKL